MIIVSPVVVIIVLPADEVPIPTSPPANRAQTDFLGDARITQTLADMLRGYRVSGLC